MEAMLGGKASSILNKKESKLRIWQPISRQPAKALSNLWRRMFNLSEGGLPIGAKISEYCFPVPTSRKLNIYRIVIILLTYVSYCCYYIARKPISVVKTKIVNCTNDTEGQIYCSSFISEIDGARENEAKMLLGVVDTSFLMSYALFTFVSGVICDRLDLRYFLSFGMILAGLVTVLFGSAYYWGIHSIGWFIVMQILCGAFQSTGWPGVMSAVTNWFGKGKKGLFLGIWYSHTSAGSILGSLLAGFFVEESWGLSFIVPGTIVAVGGLLVFFVLVPRPEQVGLQLNQQMDKSGKEGCADVNVEKQVGAERKVDNEIKEEKVEAITFLSALKIPGVIEFSLCFFFAKLVSYTFIYWLPTFIKATGINVSSESAAYLTTLFDVGGLIGAILAGIFSDLTGKSASTCAVMLFLCIPMLFGYQYYSDTCPLNWSHHDSCYSGNIGLLLLLGLLVQGPNALISTAVSAELGSNPMLTGSTKALATVTAIINGTGSVGAAIGPFLAGAIPTIEMVFIMMMVANGIALLLLTRLVVRDVQEIIRYFLGSRKRLHKSNTATTLAENCDGVDDF